MERGRERERREGERGQERERGVGTDETGSALSGTLAPPPALLPPPPLTG